jgi:flagellar assembly factor FliW
VRIETQRFGQIELEEKDLIHFGGLPGFPRARRFVLLGHDRGQAFAWLLCADDPELAFAVTDPWQFFPDYDPGFEPRHLRPLGVASGEDLEILAIASVAGGRTRLNLAAPLVIHAPTRRGAQIILDGTRWSTREEVPAPVLARAPSVPVAEAAAPAPGAGAPPLPGE